MAASEFETVNDDGFVFKVRKRRLDEINVKPLAAKEGQPHEDQELVGEQSQMLETKAKRLLTLKAMYEAELEAWKKLEEAAATPVLEELSAEKSPASPEHDVHAEFLKELKIEVENVEEYIRRLQDHIFLAESTYKLCVKEMREDANFRPADEIVLALTGQAVSDDVIATQASLGSSASLSDV